MTSGLVAEREARDIDAVDQHYKERELIEFRRLVLRNSGDAIDDENLLRLARTRDIRFDDAANPEPESVEEAANYFFDALTRRTAFSIGLSPDTSRRRCADGKRNTPLDHGTLDHILALLQEVHGQPSIPSPSDDKDMAAYGRLTGPREMEDFLAAQSKVAEGLVDYLIKTDGARSLDEAEHAVTQALKHSYTISRVTSRLEPREVDIGKALEALGLDPKRFHTIKFDTDNTSYIPPGGGPRRGFQLVTEHP